MAPKAIGSPIQIAYYDQTNGQLKYYASAPINWKVVVDDIGVSDDHVGISMKLDEDGNPVIAYKQIIPGFQTSYIRIARPHLAYGEDEFGNCGDYPPGYIFLYWRCATIGGGPLHNTASYASLAITSNGLAGVAYSDRQTFPSEVYRVKITYQTLLRTYLPISAK